MFFIKSLNYQNVNITDGYWYSKQQINRKITANAVWNRFFETGRVKAFECIGDPQPHIFWDSDVAKWIEGAAALLHFEQDTDLEQKIEYVIDCIEKNQLDDGYFNSYYITLEPENRFTNRNNHELYCAGHLIEAAIEYFNATGKRRFLDLMLKYVDFIYDLFYVKDAACFVTPGHEEIEIALLKLYDTTNNKKYLDLAMFFLNKRGNNDKDQPLSPSANMRYEQAHLPVREQFEAEGHAVRALYLYTSMADAAIKTGDKELRYACERLFEDITQKKMYITGGLGQTYVGEAFTVAYDLPSDTAYAETCASIAMVLFCNKMLELTGESKYADVIERELYNGALSGVSLDGKSFFYENPLEIDVANYNKDRSRTKQRRYPITQRVEVFGCSCCPPNILRFVAKLGQYIYSKDDDTLYVNQFVTSTCDKIVMTTDFPNSSEVRIKADVPSLCVRIPEWCDKFEINKPYTVKNGYALITDTSGEIVIDLNMRVKLIAPNPKINALSGKAALLCGPVVYCAESIDNIDTLSALYFATDLDAKSEYNELFDINTITVNGFERAEQGELYCEYTDTFKQTKIKLIPYIAFANRGETNMKVWLNIR